MIYKVRNTIFEIDYDYVSSIGGYSCVNFHLSIGLFNFITECKDHHKKDVLIVGEEIKGLNTVYFVFHSHILIYKDIKNKTYVNQHRPLFYYRVNHLKEYLIEKYGSYKEAIEVMKGVGISRSMSIQLFNGFYTGIQMKTIDKLSKLGSIDKMFKGVDE